LDHAEVVAVGECGLDYFRDFSPRDLQQRAFVAQLELAAESRRPVFLHQRDAHEDFLRLLRPFRDALAGGVAHCFTGGPRELEDCLELDLYIGVTGWLCDERRGAALREAAREIPLERLLIETDAPYLLPRDLQPKPRSRRNEPCYLPHILERLAALRAEPVTLLAETTRRNSEELFRLTPPA
jgi:TatD DNase family protein